MARRRSTSVANAAQLVIQNIINQRQQQRQQQQQLAGQIYLEDFRSGNQRGLEGLRHTNDLSERTHGTNETVRGHREMGTFDADLKLKELLAGAPQKFMESIKGDQTPEAIVNTARNTRGIQMADHWNQPAVRTAMQAGAVAMPGHPDGSMPDVVEQALRSRQAMADKLKADDIAKRSAVAQDKERVDATTGVKGFVDPANQSFIPTERTGTQQGQMDASKEVAANSPAAVRSRAGAAASVAGAETGARVGATINTEHSNLGKVHDIAVAKHVTDPNASGGTEAAKKAAALLNVMLGEHVNALALEEKGSSLRPNIASVTASPTLLEINQGRIGQTLGTNYTDDDINYYRAANAFTNLEGFRLSGVTVREDERDNFLTSMFKVGGEPPEVTKKKQIYRQTLLDSLQLAAGGAKEAAGVAIANSIKSGRLPDDIMDKMQWDPVILQSILKEFQKR